MVDFEPYQLFQTVTSCEELVKLEVVKNRLQLCGSVSSWQSPLVLWCWSILYSLSVSTVVCSFSVAKLRKDAKIGLLK